MKRIAVTLLLLLVPAWLAGMGASSTAADQPSFTVMAAGDIACDPRNAHFNRGQGDRQACHELATASLLTANHPDAVLALGDNQYEEATLFEFLSSYEPSWGQLKAMTYPVLGNHEYESGNAEGYFAYYGSLAHPEQGGYYSFDLDGWHFIALNSNCSFVGGCGVGSRQETWLLSDLAAHRNACTVAYWHYPRFTSGANLNHPEMQTFWDDLYAEGADIVLNGHDHIYERFAPQNPQQQADANGIREFIVGTGGNNHQPKLAIVQPNSLVRNNTTFGVLKLILHPDSYDWQFIPDAQAGNGTFSDKGSGTCHGAPSGSDNGNGPRAIPVVTTVRPGQTVARFTVDFTSAEPGQAKVLFGPGPGCSGLVMTATGDQGTGTTHHVFVVTGNDLAGTVGDVGITPGATYWYETATTMGAETVIDDNGGKCYSVTVPAR